MYLTDRLISFPTASSVPQREEYLLLSEKTEQLQVRLPDEKPQSNSMSTDGEIRG